MLSPFIKYVSFVSFMPFNVRDTSFYSACSAFSNKVFHKAETLCLPFWYKLFAGVKHFVKAAGTHPLQVIVPSFVRLCDPNLITHEPIIL